MSLGLDILYLWSLSLCMDLFTWLSLSKSVMYLIYAIYYLELILEMNLMVFFVTARWWDFHIKILWFWSNRAIGAFLKDHQICSLYGQIAINWDNILFVTLGELIVWFLQLWGGIVDKEWQSFEGHMSLFPLIMIMSG